MPRHRIGLIVFDLAATLSHRFGLGPEAGVYSAGPDSFATNTHDMPHDVAPLTQRIAGGPC